MITFLSAPNLLLPVLLRRERTTAAETIQQIPFPATIPLARFCRQKQVLYHTHADLMTYS